MQGAQGKGQTGHELNRPPRAFIRAMESVTRKQHGMSDRFEDGCLSGAVRFVATGQPAYLRLGGQDGLSLPVRIDAPIVPRSSSQKIVDYRKIAIDMPVVVVPKSPSKMPSWKDEAGGSYPVLPFPQPQAAHQSSGGGMRLQADVDQVSRGSFSAVGSGVPSSARVAALSCCRCCFLSFRAFLARSRSARSKR